MNLKIKDKKLLANFLSIITLFTCFLVFAGSRPAFAGAGTNQQLSFSGKITKSDNTNITDGTYNMEFKVYQDGNSSGAGSTLKWTEDYLVAGSSGMPSTGGVTLSGGTFQVNLGSICALSGGSCGAKTNTAVDFNQQTLWLSIQIGNTSACTVTSSTTSFNTACGGDGEMTPFIRLTAVPQALNADTLDGIDSSGFVQLNASQSGNITLGSSGILKVGSVDSTLTAQALNIGTSNAGTITMGNVTNSTFLFKTKSSSTAIAFQNSSGYNVLAVDTSANHLKIFDGTTNQYYADVYYDDGSSSAYFKASTGTTVIGSGTGATTINAGGSSAITITGHANSTWSTDSGALTLQSAAAATWSTAGGVLTIQGAGGLALTATTGNITAQTGGTWLVQNGSSVPYLSANTSSNVIQVGSATTDATAILLGLDNYNSATDPTGSNGDMYYNSNLQKFRCYENGAWANCITPASSGPNAASFLDTTPGTMANNTTTEIFNDTTRPNITPSATTSKILVSTTVRAHGTSTSDSSSQLRIVYNVGSAASCSTSSTLGDVFNTSFTTNSATTDKATGNYEYVYAPSTTSTVYFTVCSNAMSGGQGIDAVTVNLDELK